MKLFECQQCGQLLNFQNTHCERCSRVLGYLPDEGVVTALEPLDSRRWLALAAPGRVFRFCANDAHSVCNWLVPEDAASAYCAACRLNRTIPDLSNPRHVLMWQRLEAAKHRLVYGLMRLELPLSNRWDDPGAGLAFDFLAPSAVPTEGPLPPVIMTGHNRGLITINITEADDVEREFYRANLGEPYRTVLGHFRHEVGHYYWDRLISGQNWLWKFRELFGDETQDYSQSLTRNYEQGPPEGWGERHISPYASAHPWEDWAETWAHYLHMLDTVETAYAFGLSLSPRAGKDVNLSVMQNLDPYGPIELDALLSRWLPLVYAGNSLNRSMGQPDLYPFILRPAIIQKLRFVHEVARASRGLISRVASDVDTA